MNVDHLLLRVILLAGLGCGKTSSAPIDPGGGPALPGTTPDGASLASPDASVTPRPRSCAALDVDAGDRCGATQHDDCCSSPVVAGGSFYRGNDGVHSTDKSYPATVSTFRLDRYEITVARFRAFVEAFPASKPSTGDGAHPLIPNSGWQPTWPLPADAAALRQELLMQNSTCAPTQGVAPPTWTDAPSSNEQLPINCVSWYEIFAFCAWDGGRLPTEAEFGFAFAGGAEQRVYPWSEPPAAVTIDSSFAVYSVDNTKPLRGPERVGSRPKGKGRWGQLDLAGNLQEMLLDTDSTIAPGACINCADIEPGLGIATMGGSWGANADFLLATQSGDVLRREQRALSVGGRCARTP